MSEKPSTDAPVTAFVCGEHWCGKAGQEHDMTGPVVSIGNGESVTCSRCGIDAMSVDLLRLP